MNRKAFTIIELVFVIIVVGILATIAIPRLDRDVRQEAVDTLLSGIQLTQHLALIDDKKDPRNADWGKELWTIQIASDGDNSFYYTIFSDQNHNGTAEKEESTIDPSTGKYIFNDGDRDIEDGESPTAFLYKYGVNRVNFGDSCPNNHLSFDRFGRLFSSIEASGFDGYQSDNCVITLGFQEGEDATITIEAETGYARVSG